MKHARIVRLLLLIAAVPLLLAAECDFTELTRVLCEKFPEDPKCTTESTTEIMAEGRLGTSAPGTVEDTGQDAYEFDVAAGTTITVTIEHDGNLEVEAAVFAPGVSTDGTAIVDDGSVPDGGTIGDGPIGPLAEGIHTVALEDDRGNSNEVAGDYKITITSDIPFRSGLTQTIDEGPETLLIDPNP